MDASSVSRVLPLTGELSNGISEAVLVSSQPRGRSDTIFSIVEEICETVAWLHGPRATDDLELTSLHLLLAEARAHRERMVSRQADEAPAITCV